MSEEKKAQKMAMSRRDSLTDVGAGAAAATVASTAIKQDEVEAEEGRQAINELPGVTTAVITLRINGRNYEVEVEPRTTLLSVLRDGIDTNGQRLNLTGAKQICDRGECGGCTVIMDGKAIYSCMTLVIDAQGKDILTVEGLEDGDKLHPLQEAFIEHDALQCGFCTPGFLMTAKALLDTNRAPTLEEIKGSLSGNVCRCGAYTRIFEAVQTAAKRMG